MTLEWMTHHCTVPAADFLKKQADGLPQQRSALWRCCLDSIQLAACPALPQAGSNAAGNLAAVKALVEQ